MKDIKPKINQLLDKKVNRKKFLQILGLGVAAIPLLSPSVAAKFFLRQTNGTLIDIDDLSPGGSSSWGSITGTLSNQTDLQTELDNKADDSAVVKLTGNQTIAGTKTFSSTISGSIDGNAGTATTWQTARTLTIGSTGKSVNGSGNVSWNLTEIGAPSTTGTGASGTWGISITGNAATASSVAWANVSSKPDTATWPTNTWLTSAGDGNSRLYFGSGSHTYLRSAGDIYLRAGGNNNKLTITSTSTQIHGDSTNNTWTTPGQLAIKRSTGSPYISFHADTGARNGYLQIQDTGVARLSVEANQPLYLATNATDHVAILASGNVGIGTTNPVNKLHVGTGSSGYNGNDLAIENGTEAMAFRQTPTVSEFYTTRVFAFMPSGSSATGRVGIGTTNPSTALHVNGTVTATTFAGSLSGSASQLNGYASATSGANVVLRTNASGYIAHLNWIQMGNGTGLYCPNGSYLYNDTTYGWFARSPSSSTSSLRLQTSDGTARGWFYANTSYEQGFLTSGGSWALRVDNGGNSHSFRHSLSGTNAYYSCTDTRTWRVWNPSGIFLISDMTAVADRLGIFSDGSVNIPGTLTKGGGTFKIDHPLDPLNSTLYHGFVEAPRYDLIYRGKIKLKNGEGIVNIDASSNMTEGTFEALTQNRQVTSLQNETSFNRMRATKIEDGKFKIICEDTNSDDVVGWVVIAERADAFVKHNEGAKTDDKGRLIPEWEKEEYNE